MIKKLCWMILRARGWKFKVELPSELRSFVFIGAPHTSNYDFLPAMAVAYLMKRNARFVIKSEWMKFPMNIFMGPIGAIGLDRSLINEGKPQSNTDLMAALFKQESELALMIAPEGTRKPNDQWKTGFYYVAQKAGVPIVLGYGDYARQEAGIGLIIHPQDPERDMQAITDFYRPIQGRNPQNFKTDRRY
jgi:1-acyl-sn-glycerol-3-phosphate acyltransferase